MLLILHAAAQDATLGISTIFVSEDNISDYADDILFYGPDSDGPVRDEEEDDEDDSTDYEAWRQDLETIVMDDGLVLLSDLGDRIESVENLRPRTKPQLKPAVADLKPYLVKPEGFFPPETPRTFIKRVKNHGETDNYFPSEAFTLPVYEVEELIGQSLRERDFQISL